MPAPKRIVVIDDDVYFLQLAAHCLRPPEFELFTYADARDALMKLHEIEPDLIVSDVLMPEMDGRTFFQVVKRSPRLKDVPFIFLSGVRTPEDIVSMLNGGADDFLTKPVPVHSLVAKIRATLRMAERLAQVEPRREFVSGTTGAEGALPLLRFCRDTRLTGRVTLESGERNLLVEFVGGEVVDAKAQPDAVSQPVESLLLALQEASYRLEQRSAGPRDSEERGTRLREDGWMCAELAALLELPDRAGAEPARRLDATLTPLSDTASAVPADAVSTNVTAHTDAMAETEPVHAEPAAHMEPAAHAAPTVSTNTAHLSSADAATRVEIAVPADAETVAAAAAAVRAFEAAVRASIATQAEQAGEGGAPYKRRRKGPGRKRSPRCKTASAMPAEALPNGNGTVGSSVATAGSAGAAEPLPSSAAPGADTVPESQPHSAGVGDDTVPFVVVQAAGLGSEPTQATSEAAAAAAEQPIAPPLVGEPGEAATSDWPEQIDFAPAAAALAEAGRPWPAVATAIILLVSPIAVLASVVWLAQWGLRAAEPANQAAGPKPGANAVAAPSAPPAPKVPVRRSPPPAVLQATLRVISDPPGATVLVGRSARGTTPVRLRLAAGKVAVSLRKEGFVPWTRNITLSAGREASLDADLTAVPEETSSTPAPLASERAVRVDDLVPLTPAFTPPKRISEEPSFTNAFPKLKRSASVLVEFVVTEDGSVTDARIVESGGAAVDKACLEAIKGRRYQPAELKGVRVKVVQQARFTFEPH